MTFAVVFVADNDPVGGKCDVAETVSQSIAIERFSAYFAVNHVILLAKWLIAAYHIDVIGRRRFMRPYLYGISAGFMVCPNETVPEHIEAAPKNRVARPMPSIKFIGQHINVIAAPPNVLVEREPLAVAANAIHFRAGLNENLNL